MFVLVLLVAAPKARNMKARGKSRLCWDVAPGKCQEMRSSPERVILFRPFRPWRLGFFATRGDALRACPWLSYIAPLALPGCYNPGPLALRPWVGGFEIANFANQAIAPAKSFAARRVA